MFRRTYDAHTLDSGDLFNKKWSLDSAVQIIQQTNKSNNGSTCTTGSTCNTNSLIKITGAMATCMAALTLYCCVSTVYHFYDAYDTSNNCTIRAPNQVVVCGGGTTSQAIFHGAMSFSGAISAACLVFLTGLIQSVHAIGLR